MIPIPSGVRMEAEPSVTSMTPTSRACGPCKPSTSTLAKPITAAACWASRRQVNTCVLDTPQRSAVSPTDVA